MNRWQSNLIGTKKTEFWVNKAQFVSSALTANRAFSLPDKAGTLATLDDLKSIPSAVTIYVCPEGQFTAYYDGAGPYSVTPSDSNSGLTPTDPLATIEAAAAKIRNKIGYAVACIQVADTDSGKAYFADNVVFNMLPVGAMPFSSILEKALVGRSDQYPPAYVYLKGNTSNPNAVNVTGAATAGGTTSTKQTAFVAQFTYLRVRGMKINYFRAANGDAGAIAAYGGTVVVEDVNSTSDHTDNDGSLVSGFMGATILLGGQCNATNTGFARANMGARWQLYSPLGYLSLNFSHSGTNCAAFMANEGSHCLVQTEGTMSFTGSGSYTCFWAITNSSINFNNDAQATSWTFNCANAIINKALQRSVINETLGTSKNPTTFTAFARRAFVDSDSSVSYQGTNAGTLGDFVRDAEVRFGSFPYTGYKSVGVVQGTVPTPPSGYFYTYFKSDGLYYKNSAGTEIGPLGTGGGGGATLGANTFTDTQTILHNQFFGLDMRRTGAGQHQFRMRAGGDNSWESAVWNCERYGGTEASPTAVASNHNLFALNAAGHDGTDYRGSASITAKTAGAFSSTSWPTRIELSTTPSGSTSSSVKLSVEPDGVKVGSSGSVFSSILSASQALDFGNTAAQTSTDLTITVTGAAVGDPVFLATPAAPNANSCFTAWVSAANTVTVRFNNYSSGAINPASGTYRVAVMKFV